METVFADLGKSPIANALVTRDRLQAPETYFPLKAYVCESCLLVQLGTTLPADAHFHEDYVYFSSVSDSWLEHAEAFAAMAISKFRLDSNCRVIEIGSNDGYLLRFFIERGIPALGVDPAANCARAAWDRHAVPTEVAFFGADMAGSLVARGMQADLLVGNNVLAHVPDPIDFVQGLKLLLKPDGVLSIEVPHVLELIGKRQFDTIYHEHYFYYSLRSLSNLFERGGLRIFDVERLTTHGGSLRVFAAHVERHLDRGAAFSSVLDEEHRAGLHELSLYAGFNKCIAETKRDILETLLEIKRNGKAIAAYGAPAKGSTLLNYCGIGMDFIDFTVEKSASKQGRFLPGSNIPIMSPDAIFAAKPDYVLILPWNIADEIRSQMGEIASWGGRFIIPIPQPTILG